MPDYLPDRIFAPEHLVKDIAEQNGTPFYLYHKEGIAQSIRKLHDAFLWAPGFQNYFHIRENNNPHILKILKQEGTGVCACSYVELLLAQHCGFSGEQLLYEPSERDPDACALALELDATWLVHSEYLLPDVLPERIIVHYHPLEEWLSAVKFPKIGNSKSGISQPEIFDVLMRLHERGVQMLGLYVQVSSYSIVPGFWEKKTQILLKLAQDIKNNLNIPLWALHIGEGPGLPYRPNASAPELEDEAARVHALFKNLVDENVPLLFTGVNRRLLEHNGLLVAKVLEYRRLYKPFLVLDAGMTHYIRPVLKQAYRHVSVLGKYDIGNRKQYHLIGPMPEEMDRIAQKPRMLPEVHPGDYCLIHDVGCGARTMAMVYGTRGIAAEYLYSDDGIQPIAPGRSPQELLDFLTTW